MKLLIALLLGIITYGNLYSQKTIEFRITTVSSNVGDMDGFGAGDSDPQWDAQILDGATSLGTFSQEVSGTNCPGTRTFNTTFSSTVYNCAFPTNFTLKWSGFEDDGIGSDANTGVQTVNIPSAALTASTFTTINTYSATAGGTACPSGSTVTWTITLQYRVIGSFAINTAPSSVSASQTFVAAGSTVNLSQIGGTSNFGATYTWYTGSCNGTNVGTGANYSPVVNNTTTYYVNSAGGTCGVTSCASITITASALGVSLLSSEAYCKEDEIYFEWETERETNNSHFEILTSEDLNKWRLVKTVEPTINSENGAKYAIQTPWIPEERYIRLRQVDLDGTTTDFDPVALDCETKNDFFFYPNPVKTTQQIQFIGGKSVAILSITDASGKTIGFDYDQSSLSLKNPKEGAYIIVAEVDGIIRQQRLIVLE